MIEEHAVGEYDGVRLGWSRHAPEPAGRPEGECPTLVFVHGNPGSRNDWRRVVREASRTESVIAIDRPGYGASRPAASRDMTMGRNAAAIAALASEEAPGGAIFIGHSYGGGVALLTALICPELTRGLVLVASIGSRYAILRSDVVSATPVLGEMLSFFTFKVLGRLSPGILARAASVRGPAASKSEITTNLRRALAVPGVWRSYVREQRHMIAQTPILESRLGEIASPTLVVAGEGDALVPEAASLALAAGIPGARLETLPRTGHTIPMERPRALARIITGFAAGLRADPSK